jgi:excisionase family DNA binding protein
MNGDWLTPREVAQYLRVGVDSVYDACAVGGLKHVKLGYRTIRARRDWVDTWADEKARQFGSPSNRALPPARSQRTTR